MRCCTEIAEKYDFRSCKIGSPAKVNEAGALALLRTRAITARDVLDLLYRLNGLVAE